MNKNKSAGCLAITKSTVDIVLSIAAQTSRGAFIALAVVGIGISTAVHAFYGQPVQHPVGQVAEIAAPQCYSEQAAGRMQAPLLPCKTMEYLLDTDLSLAGDKFSDDIYASFVTDQQKGSSGMPIARADLKLPTTSKTPVKLTLSLHETHRTVG